MLPTKFWFICPNDFRGDDFQKSTNQKQELTVVAMFISELGQYEQFSQRTLYICFLLSFGSFGQAVSEENICLNRPIRNKNCMWRSCLLTDRNDMCNSDRGPSIDAPYQVSVHLAKLLQRRFFLNRPIRNKNCLWGPCLLTDRDEMFNLYRGHSIDASYQVQVHLAKWFQRRRLKCEKITEDGRRTPSDGKKQKNKKKQNKNEQMTKSTISRIKMSPRDIRCLIFGTQIKMI